MESGNHILAGFQGSLPMRALEADFGLQYLASKPKFQQLLMLQPEIGYYLKQCLDLYMNEQNLKKCSGILSI